MEAAPGGGGGAAGAEGGGQTGAAAGGARGAVGAKELAYYCGPHDLKRLELYSRNLVRRTLRAVVVACVGVFCFADGWVQLLVKRKGGIGHY